MPVGDETSGVDVILILDQLPGPLSQQTGSTDMKNHEHRDGSEEVTEA